MRAWLRWLGDWLYAFWIGFGRDDGKDERASRSG